MALEVNVHEAKTHLSRLLDRAIAGEEVVIVRAGRLVRLTPLEAAPVHRMLGTAKGDFTVPDDFDAPLSDEVIAEFER